VDLCPTASDGVSFTTLQLHLSLTGDKLKWVSFVDTYNIYHGQLQPALLATFPIAFFAFDDPF
jgi:hypothetical protein